MRSIRSSDALCTALQLTNFWQDFGRDWRAGRLYVPRDEQVACGAVEAELESGRISPAWNRVLAARGGRHPRAVRAGARRVRRRDGPAPSANCGSPGSAAPRILERVDRGRDRLLDVRPTLGAGDVPRLLWRAALVEASRER